MRDTTEQEQPRAVIADDDPFARRVIKDVLQRSGVIVIAEARDGRQAVELTLHYRPDVVVMDVVMPELDGPSLLRELRKTRPELKIIFVSGYAEDAFEKSLPENEQFAFLPKPFTLTQLVKAVKETMAPQ